MKTTVEVIENISGKDKAHHFVCDAALVVSVNIDGERYGGTAYAVRTLFAGKNVNPDHVIEVLAKSMADTITNFAGGDMRKLDEYIPDFMTEFMFAAADKCRRR